MLKKSILPVFLIILSGLTTLKAQSADKNVIAVIMSGYSARVYTEKPVSDNETDMIVKAGLKAPSASNRQPWVFTVVKNDSLIQDMIPKITSGNILIAISGPATEKDAASVSFDCALATENMYLAALSLGLGARIYTGPVKSINSRLKGALGIPEGYQVITVLRVGNIDRSVDASSSASTRKNPEELVIYRK